MVRVVHAGGHRFKSCSAHFRTRRTTTSYDKQKAGPSRPGFLFTPPLTPAVVIACPQVSLVGTFEVAARVIITRVVQDRVRLLVERQAGQPGIAKSFRRSPVRSDSLTGCMYHCSFIKWSGTRVLEEALVPPRHLERAGRQSRAGTLNYPIVDRSTAGTFRSQRAW